jgi:hypothetical protein
MDKFVKARKPLRAAATKTIHEVEAELAKEDTDKPTLKDKFMKLERVSHELHDLDQKILDALLDAGASDEDYDAEYSSIEVYRDKVDTTKRKIDEFLSPRPSTHSPVPSVYSTTRSEGGDKKKNYKLPKIELRKYAGDILEWLEFWSQFEKIHDDEFLNFR